MPQFCTKKTPAEMSDEAKKATAEANLAQVNKDIAGLDPELENLENK